jgi:hypothetical protein
MMAAAIARDFARKFVEIERQLQSLVTARYFSICF